MKRKTQSERSCPLEVKLIMQPSAGCRYERETLLSHTDCTGTTTAGAFHTHTHTQKDMPYADLLLYIPLLSFLSGLFLENTQDSDLLCLINLKYSSDTKRLLFLPENKLFSTNGVLGCGCSFLLHPNISLKVKKKK